MSYALLDSGGGRKLEQFGEYVIDRPSAQAVWRTQQPEKVWRRADASFTRDSGNQWRGLENLPESWVVDVFGFKFKISPTDFGHLGVFPEQASNWHWLKKLCSEAGREVSLLNLFAYSGGVSVASALGGAQVCHVDASKGMVEWASENAHENGVGKKGIRWIVDDVAKFLRREVKRGRRYDSIVMDPPSFGRGAKGEVFKIERDLPELMDLCRSLLSDDPVGFLFSCHTPGYTPLVMEHLMRQLMEGLGGHIETGEMVLEGVDPSVLPLVSGVYARWSK